MVTVVVSYSCSSSSSSSSPFLFLRTYLFGVLTAYLFSSTSAATSYGKRNILFMIEDDGSMDYSVYGNDIIASPNIAKLASSGTVFDNYHTSVSSCSPSRSTVMSGLPTHQNGMYGLQHQQEHFSSFDEVIGISTYLNTHNYVTGIIGKYHVWPNYVYNFTWGNDPNGPGGCQAGASTACPMTDYDLVSRNITYMNEQVQLFLQYAHAQEKPWFLYIGFGDSHRCGGNVGQFCELYGYDTDTNQSTIPDWHPIQYTADDITKVPFFIQNTTIARTDIANMYTVKNRIDQGVGLFLNTLQNGPFSNDYNNTLIMFTSDNGIPFAAGKTNLYEIATIEPMIIVVPNATHTGVRTSLLSSSLDLVPTWLDWLQLPLPNYTVLGTRITYTGQSVLPYITTNDDKYLIHDPSLRTHQPTIRYKHRVQHTIEEIQASLSVVTTTNIPKYRQTTPIPLPTNYSIVFGSFQLHEIQEYFPMRSATAIGSNGAHYRLIYNIAHWLPYPIASDLWTAPATQDLINLYHNNSDTTVWYRNISWYFYQPDARTLYELYDLVNDPMELTNVAYDPSYSSIFTTLQTDIKNWQYLTNDDWTIKYTHE